MAGRRKRLAVGLFGAVLAGLAPATAHAISGSTGAGLVGVLFFVGLHALLGLVLFEIGLGLLLVRPQDRTKFGLGLAASVVALFVCLRFYWLAPLFVVLPVAVALWPERRDRALGLAAAALAIGAICGVFETVGWFAFLCTLALPALPLGVLLWHDGRKRLAVVTLAGFVVGMPLYSLTGMMTMESNSTLLLIGTGWALPALLASPLAYFIKREGKPRLALAVLIGTATASLLLDFWAARAF